MRGCHNGCSRGECSLKPWALVSGRRWPHKPGLTSRSSLPALGVSAGKSGKRDTPGHIALQGRFERESRRRGTVLPASARQGRFERECGRRGTIVPASARQGRFERESGRRGTVLPASARQGRFERESGRRGTILSAYCRRPTSNRARLGRTSLLECARDAHASP